MQHFSRIFLIFLFLGLILRIILGVWSLGRPLNGDIPRYAEWARNAFIYGLSDGYTTAHFAKGDEVNQPPGTIYILDTMYVVHLQVSHILTKLGNGSIHTQFLNDTLLPGILRIPSFIADALLALLIYLLVKKYMNEKSAIIGSMLFYFNPAVIYNSSVWGQMDSVNNLFFFFALFLLLKRRYLFSLFVFFLSLYIKVSLLPMLPLFFLCFLFQMSFSKFLIYLGVIIAGLLLLTLPFSFMPYLWLPQTIFSISQRELSSITVGAFNFWWLVTRPSASYQFSSSTRFINISLGEWASGLFGLSYIPVVCVGYLIKKKVLEPKNIFLLFSLVALITFLFLPKMHERYLYPLFPLLATYCGLQMKYFKVFIFLSVLHFLNLFIIWQPGYFFWVPYTVIRDPNFRWLLSLLTVGTGIYFYITTLFFISSKNKLSQYLTRTRERFQL